MPERILFVDDDPNILNGYRRSLRGQFELETAPDGIRGLEVLAEKGPFEVVVSDLRMPSMDGIQFLSMVRERAPDTVRIMLTGFAEVQTAIDAVNEGNIFRFLTKPCSPERFTGVLEQGIKHHRLVTAERELLEKTLKGAIKLLTDLLALLNPEAFGRASRIRRYAVSLAAQLGVDEIWQIETAALLSQVGCLILPEETLRKAFQGEELTPEESYNFKTHPHTAAQLLSNIPRMQEIAEIIAYQNKNYDGSGMPHNGRQGGQIPLGARILKVVLDFDLLESRGLFKGKAFTELKRRPERFDPRILQALGEVLGDEARYVVSSVNVTGLRAHMILAEDVTTLTGRLLLSRGQEVSPLILERLRSVAANAGVKEPIRVFVPLQLEAGVGPEA